MSNSWSNLPTDDYKDANFDNYLEKLAEPLKEPPKPDIKTELVDVAAGVESGETYIPKERKPFKEKKEAGITSVSEPVNIYEPGFRSDMYAAMVKYFREKKKEKENVQKLRERIGLRG